MNKPTDEQLDEFWDEIGGYYNLYPEVRNTIREALNRWGTPEPIALEDREPHHTDLDYADQCWLWRTDGIEEFWELVVPPNNIHKYNQTSHWKYTHWLPHWAIKTPEVKDETTET